MEKSLNDPLSGEEVKAIILQRVSDAMERDTTLYNDLAYAGFSARFECKITFLRSLTKPTLIWADDVQGEGEPDGGTSVAMDFQTDQPDVARQEHNLPVPVMQQTPSGPKKVKVRIEKARK